MHCRSIVFALTLLASALCFACIAGSSAARAEEAPPPPTSTPAVEVEGKVIERGPEKAPVPIEEMPMTGTGHSGTLLVVGLALLAVGVVLIDRAPAAAPAGPRLPHRGV